MLISVVDSGVSGKGGLHEPRMLRTLKFVTTDWVVIAWRSGVAPVFIHLRAGDG